MTTAAPSTPQSVGRTVTSLPDDRTIVMTRSFEAPRELVWDLWTDPDLIPDFWGPAEHDNTVQEWDLQVGGKWRIISKFDEGGMVDFHGEFLQIERPSLIEWTFGFDDTPPGPETLYLDEVDGVTTMRSVTVFPNKEIRDMVIGTGMEKGASEMHDRFAKLVAERLAS